MPPGCGADCSQRNRRRRIVRNWPILDEKTDEINPLDAIFLPPAADPPPRDREAELPQLAYLERKKAPYLNRIKIIKSPRFLMSAYNICDRAYTDEMNRHLLDIAASVPDGRHAPVVLDCAGWHCSKALEIPASAALLRLPPCSPELNPVETVFQFLKSRHFANQIFETADAVKEKVGAVRSDFTNSPDRIRSLGARSWGELA